MRTVSSGAQALAGVPTLDEIAAAPELAAPLGRDIALALNARAVRALAALQGALLAAATSESKDEASDRRLLDAGDAAARLGVPESWLRDQARRGKLPSVQLGHYVRFKVDDLDGYIIEHRRA